MLVFMRLNHLQRNVIWYYFDGIWITLEQKLEYFSLPLTTVCDDLYVCLYIQYIHIF